MTGRLAGKIALVTGAAAGIGAATAELFHRAAAAVVILDRDPRGEELARGLGTEVSPCLFVRADVSQESELRDAFEEVSRRFGRLDVLVNNAAAFVMKGLEATVEDWRQSLDVNVIGTALCSRFAVELMKTAGSGSIVNVGSISSFIAQPEFLTYSASKAAVVQTTRCMAADLAPHQIRVNCVCPGTIRTPATDRHLEREGMSETEFLAEQAPHYLLGRIGEPREVAQAILFLASDEASFITATSLMVDGGYLAR